MKIRYYADVDVQSWHEHALELLETIHDEHDLPIEIDRVRERYGPVTEFPGNVRSPTPEEAYERDLKNNRDLIDKIDQPPSKAYKRSGTIEIAGNVAIVDDGVQWASTFLGYADGYGLGVESQTAMDFLEDVAQSPSNRVCIECLHQLDGDETFCPSCGFDLPFVLLKITKYLNNCRARRNR